MLNKDIDTTNWKIKSEKQRRVVNLKTEASTHLPIKEKQLAVWYQLGLWFLLGSCGVCFLRHSFLEAAILFLGFLGSCFISWWGTKGRNLSFVLLAALYLGLPFVTSVNGWQLLLGALVISSWIIISLSKQQVSFLFGLNENNFSFLENRCRELEKKAQEALFEKKRALQQEEKLQKELSFYSQSLKEKTLENQDLQEVVMQLNTLLEEKKQFLTLARQEIFQLETAYFLLQKEHQEKEVESLEEDLQLSACLMESERKRKELKEEIETCKECLSHAFKETQKISRPRKSKVKAESKGEQMSLFQEVAQSGHLC